MKGLIYIDEKYLINNKFDLIENQTLLLNICGKSVLEYYIDFFYTLGVDEIFIVGEKLDKFILKNDVILHNTITITSLRADNLIDCYKRNNDLFQKEEMIMIENIGFIFDKHMDINTLKNNTKTSQENFSVYYINNHNKNIDFSSFDSKNFLDIKSLENIEDYISITNAILNNLSNYDSIPGYTKDDNIVIGKNVVIDSDCKLNGPLIILDNVKICKGSLLGPNSIIGKDTFIHENSRIINSVIYDNTYIGENLDIKNKIISSGYLIDKLDIGVYKIDDMFLSKNNTWVF